jgi:hypothetical protein
LWIMEIKQNCTHEEIKRIWSWRSACCHLDQNFLSACLQPKNIKTEVYRSTVLVIVCVYVKLGFVCWVKNVAWGCWGCWGQYLGLWGWREQGVLFCTCVVHFISWLLFCNHIHTVWYNFLCNCNNTYQCVFWKCLVNIVVSKVHFHRCLLLYSAIDVYIVLLPRWYLIACSELPLQYRICIASFKAFI